MSAEAALVERSDARIEREVGPLFDIDSADGTREELDEICLARAEVARLRLILRSTRTPEAVAPRPPSSPNGALSRPIVDALLDRERGALTRRLADEIAMAQALVDAAREEAQSIIGAAQVALAEAIGNDALAPPVAIESQASVGTSPAHREVAQATSTVFRSTWVDAVLVVLPLTLLAMVVLAWLI